MGVENRRGFLGSLGASATLLITAACGVSSPSKRVVAPEPTPSVQPTSPAKVIQPGSLEDLKHYLSGKSMSRVGLEHLTYGDLIRRLSYTSWEATLLSTDEVEGLVVANPSLKTRSYPISLSGTEMPEVFWYKSQAILRFRYLVTLTAEWIVEQWAARYSQEYNWLFNNVSLHFNEEVFNITDGRVNLVEVKSPTKF